MSDDTPRPAPAPQPSRPLLAAWSFIASVDVEGGGKIHEVPGDPGGVTKWGFAQKFNPDIDVRDLTYVTAFERFAERYWNPLHCEELPPAVAIAVVDYAFNAGADDAIPALQQTAGSRVDGSMGPRTITAVNERFRQRPGRFLDDFFSWRTIKYLKSPRVEDNRGWLVRCFKLRAFLERETWK